MRNRNISDYSKTYCQTKSSEKFNDTTLNTSRPHKHKNQDTRSPSISTEELPDYKSIKSTDKILHFNEFNDIAYEKQNSLKYITFLKQSLKNIQDSLSPTYKFTIPMQLLLDNLKIIEIEVKKIRKSDAHHESISVFELQKINHDYARSLIDNPLNISELCKEVKESTISSPHNMINVVNSALADMIAYFKEPSTPKPKCSYGWMDSSFDTYVSTLYDLIESQRYNTDAYYLERCFKEKELRYKKTIVTLTTEICQLKDGNKRGDNNARNGTDSLENYLKDTLSNTIKSLKDFLKDDKLRCDNAAQSNCTKQLRILNEQIRYLRAEVNSIKSHNCIQMY